jgi:probable F420-dependent oxidoreductase
MQFWQSLFLTEADQIFDVVKICEEVGFDGVLVSDHLLHFERMEPRYPYSPDGRPPSFSAETAWPECWSLIAGLSAVTGRIRFATNVYILPLRHPIEVAKATASVAFFGEGRLCLGAGAGWMREEFEALGVDFHTRGRRFDECIEVIRALWTGEVVEHHGEFFDLPGVKLCPVPRQRVPIHIGGTSPAALRRAARLGDGWLGPGQLAEDALDTLVRLDALRREAGRADAPFETVVPLVTPPDLDTLRRLEDAGASGAVSYPFAFSVAPSSSLDQKRAYLESYANDVIEKLRRGARGPGR